jgi:hypothetical protein
MRFSAIALPVAAIILGAATLAAQQWSGTWARRDGQPSLTLTFTQDQSGQVSGQLIGPGLVFQLQGQPQGVGIMGRVTAAAGSGWFEAAFAGDDIQLVLYDSGPDGSPNPATGQQFFFARRQRLKRRRLRPLRRPRSLTPANSTTTLLSAASGGCFWRARRRQR